MDGKHNRHPRTVKVLPDPWRMSLVLSAVTAFAIVVHLHAGEGHRRR